jgi:ribonuclease/clavin/mitogillin
MLPSIHRVSTAVLRVLGQNPGPMTLQGTNTYLIGTGAKRLLLDTGEGIPTYQDELRAALAQERTSSATAHDITVSDVLLTHWHQDHVGGIRHVHELFPNATFHKLPSSRNDHAVTEEARQLGITLHDISKDSVFAVEGATLLPLLTPGHTDDHVSFLLKEEHAVFTGDCVLGSGSSVFACFHDFMSSLQYLRDVQPKVLYPGHGEVVADGTARIQEYMSHRMQREAQIVQAMTSEGRPLTAMGIVQLVYSTTPPQLHMAAAGNVIHHLGKLEREGAAAVDVAHTNEAALSRLRSMDAYSGGEGSSVDLELLQDIVTNIYWTMKRL